MRLESIRVMNFKSYLDSGEILLSPGINLVVGRNSAGKSVLLDAIGLRFIGQPHRSIKSMPHPDDAEMPVSRVSFKVQCAGIDLKRTFLKRTNQAYFPLPEGMPQDANQARLVVEGLFNATQVVATMEATALKGSVAGINSQLRLPVSYEGAPETFGPGNFVFSPDDSRREITSIAFAAGGTSIAGLVEAAILPKIFRFQAERLGLGSCNAGVNMVLAPNAQNLPEVLQNLQHNPDRFNSYVEKVRDVFPQVQAITTVPAPNNQVEARVWQLPTSTKRADLSFPLNQCGTGIGQVMGLLYVVVCSDEPQVIIIDEPNSFLHPGAARELIRVLNAFPQHQYIIATHSPEVIAEAGDCPVIRVTWEDGASRCEVHSVRNTELSRQLLQDVGARLGDVFGFDEVLWVEGPSDQAVFNLLLEHEFDPLPGLAILPVRDTGNFDRRRARDIVQIYRQASMSSAILPPTIGFILDREGRTQKDIQAIEQETDGEVSFLGRTMIENYLLHPASIATVLTSELGGEGSVSADAVSDWIARQGQLADYNATDMAVFSEAWLAKVDGAKLLRDLFGELTEQRVIFRKVVHCAALAREIMEKHSAALEALTKVVESKLKIRQLSRPYI